MKINVIYTEHYQPIEVRRINWRERCAEQLAKIDQRVAEINQSLGEIMRAWGL